MFTKKIFWKEQVSLILIPLLYIFLEIYNLNFVLEYGPEPPVIVAIVGIVVVTIRCRITRTCVVEVATSINSVERGRTLITCPYVLK